MYFTYVHTHSVQHRVIPIYIYVHYLVIPPIIIPTRRFKRCCSRALYVRDVNARYCDNILYPLQGPAQRQQLMTYITKKKKNGPVGVGRTPPYKRISHTDTRVLL